VPNFQSLSEELGVALLVTINVITVYCTAFLFIIYSLHGITNNDKHQIFEQQQTSDQAILKVPNGWELRCKSSGRSHCMIPPAITGFEQFISDSGQEQPDQSDCMLLKKKNVTR
jgi:hypothetical protein